MASVTYWAVLPFVKDEDGNLCPDEAVECQSPAATTAIRTSKWPARTCAHASPRAAWLTRSAPPLENEAGPEPHRDRNGGRSRGNGGRTGKT